MLPLPGGSLNSCTEKSGRPRSVEPRALYSVGGRSNVSLSLSTRVGSSDLETGLSPFGELPFRSYHIRLEETSAPHTWVLGSLRNLGGPDGVVYFDEIWSDLVHPSDRGRLAEIYQKILNNQSTQWRVRFRWVANSTTILHVGAFDSATRSLRGVLLDVTEGQDVGGGGQREKMSAMGLMTAGIAHDFNNLILVILSFAQFIQDETSEESQSWESINEVIKAANRASALTQQLLSFSQVKEAAAQTVDLNFRLAEIHGILSRLVGETIQLDVNLAPGPAPVWVDPVQFDQVVLNLVLNARDAMMPQGGRMSVSLEPSRDGRVLLVVKDTGKGMDSQTIERIFEPFFTTKQKGRGTGLGLATCFGIVDRAGGRIEVDSSLGEGTVITISWPLVRKIHKSSF